MGDESWEPRKNEDSDLKIRFFNHFLVIFVSFLVRSSDALGYIAHFTPIRNHSDPDCLVKIWKHNFNPFWSYDNLFFLMDFFNGFLMDFLEDPEA